MTSKEEQEVKRLKLTKEKQQNTDQQGSDSKTLGATVVSLPGIPAGPTKVGNRIILLLCKLPNHRYTRPTDRHKDLFGMYF